MTKGGFGSKKSRTVNGQFEVGYGKPPRARQFKKGQSGNPNGRRRGSKSLLTLLEQELDELITIQQSGRTRRITKRQAAAIQFVNRLITGNDRALKLLLDLSPKPEEMEDPRARAEAEASFKRFVDALNKVAGEKAAAEPDNVR